MRDWFADPANAAISSAALVVSVVALVVSVRTSRRQTAIMEAQERDRQRAGRRADLTARLERGIAAQREYAHLVVQNVGAARARKIVVLGDGEPVLVLNRGLKALGPGASYPISLAKTPAVVRITWEDDTGEPGEWESQL